MSTCLCGTDLPGHCPGASCPNVEREFSPAEQRFIAVCADEYLRERIYNSPEHFHDLMTGIDLAQYESQLQRALRNLDAACKGDKYALDAITTALSQIQRVVIDEAREAWQEECEKLSEGDLW